MNDHRDIFQLSDSEFVSLLGKFTRRAVEATFELAYSGTAREQIIAHARLRDVLPAMEAVDLLEGLLVAQDPRPDLEKRLSRHGESASVEDDYIHDFVRDAVEGELDVFAYTSEEGTEPQWAKWLSAPAGETNILGDPVDGTSNLRAIRSGMSSNLGAYDTLGNREFALWAGAATNQSKETMTYDLRRRIVQMTSPAGTVVTLANTNPGTRVSRGSYAAVAARPSPRGSVAPLIDPEADFAVDPKSYGGVMQYCEALTVYTCAGAPLMVSWPFSELEYLHVVHDQTPYDVIPLPGCLLAGGCTYYVAETGEPATVEDVAAWMSAVEGPSSENSRPVKAGILVRDTAKPETTARVLAQVRAIDARIRSQRL